MKHETTIRISRQDADSVISGYNMYPHKVLGFWADFDVDPVRPDAELVWARLTISRNDQNELRGLCVLSQGNMMLEQASRLYHEEPLDKDWEFVIGSKTYVVHIQVDD